MATPKRYLQKLGGGYVVYRSDLEAIVELIKARAEQLEISVGNRRLGAIAEIESIADEDMFPVVLVGTWKPTPDIEHGFKVHIDTDQITLSGSHNDYVSRGLAGGIEDRLVRRRRRITPQRVVTVMCLLVLASATYLLYPFRDLAALTLALNLFVGGWGARNWDVGSVSVLARQLGRPRNFFLEHKEKIALAILSAALGVAAKGVWDMVMLRVHSPSEEHRTLP